MNIEWPADQPGINLRSALKSGKDSAQYAAELKLFSDQFRHIASEIEELVFENKLASAHALLQTLKGESNKLYLESLHLTASEMNTFARNKNIQSILARLKDLEMETAKTFLFIDRIRFLDAAEEK